MTLPSSDPNRPELLVVVYARQAALRNRRYVLSPSATTTIGRDAGSTIVLDSSSVSRRHARFERRADGWWVIDEDSTNGTFVNTEQVRGALLRPGDKVSIGGTIFVLARATDPPRDGRPAAELPRGADDGLQAR